MLCIVSGPTSVGKSTFINSPRCTEITGLPPGTPAVLPADAPRLEDLGGTPPNAFYHYNTLRPLHLMRRYEQRGFPEQGAAVTSATDFGNDRQWHRVTTRNAGSKAVVLVTSRQTILRRVGQRQTIEVPEIKEQENNRYRGRWWSDLLEEVDLFAHYRAWCDELRSRGIPYVLVDSSDDAYAMIEDESRLRAVLDEGEQAHASDQTGDESRPRVVLGNGKAAHTGGSAYTKEQIQAMLQERDFAYHRVELPYGLHTKGDDRSETRDLVLPDSLAGKSVLDVGSALGYFCFEAEARGAERVVGVELDTDRFSDALLLKDIKGSKVEFFQRDVVLDPPDERFDQVLLLNVIHHLKEPLRALRQLASITAERLVVEFPTFADRRFRKTVDIEDPSAYDHLPLIGVSSMRRGVQQTFVFTPSAIERALLDHEALFAKVEILRSPMPGRAIAICHKEAPPGSG